MSKTDVIYLRRTVNPDNQKNDGSWLTSDIIVDDNAYSKEMTGIKISEHLRAALTDEDCALFHRAEQLKSIMPRLIVVVTDTILPPENIHRSLSDCKGVVMFTRNAISYVVDKTFVDAHPKAFNFEAVDKPCDNDTAFSTSLGEYFKSFTMQPKADTVTTGDDNTDTKDEGSTSCGCKKHDASRCASMEDFFRTFIPLSEIETKNTQKCDGVRKTIIGDFPVPSGLNIASVSIRDLGLFLLVKFYNKDNEMVLGYVREQMTTEG